MAVSLGKYRGWIAVLGGVLVHLTLGTIYTFGNMNPYLTSYIRLKSSPSDLTYKVSVWVFSLQGAGQGLSMFVGGYISRRIGPRWTALLGGWFMSAGVILTYFTVSHSFYAILATYGLMFGLGIGIAYAPPLACAMKLQADPEEVAPLARSPSEGSLNDDLDIQEDSSVQNDRFAPKPIERRSLSPGQILKTREFYMLWFMFFMNGNAVVFISTLWKAFGQTKIQDDHFLALVGAFSAVLNAVGRPFWGWLADRYSFKVSLMGLCTSMIFFTMTLFAVPDEADAGVGAKVMFFIWICGIFGSFCGNFSLFPTATAKTFGPDYVAVNYGLVFTSGLVSSITGGIITSALMSALGWFGMFSLVSGMTAISGIIAFLFKAKNAEGRDI
ncbi:oxalate:formate antiporter-like [Branchiostoma floridae]|uniref:Oxalate:formate antiporter-like n=1 Tax=Branchiostoma floridae TaxID=7739 RepID=A0A9J7M387_BRAFL|nr:oxalate:formate antiporter-like [Branchiostoma floridae]